MVKRGGSRNNKGTTKGGRPKHRPSKWPRKTGTRVYFDNKDMDCVEASLPYVFLVFLLAVAFYLAILSGKIPMASAMKTDQLKGDFEPVNDLSGESEGPTKTMSFWLRSQQLKPLQPPDMFFESTRWKRYDVAEFEDPMICFWLIFGTT